MSPPAVPIINMQNLLSRDTSDSELFKLHSACKEWGVFQLVNHGVTSSIMDNLHREIEGFFRLSSEEKAKYEGGPSDVEGYGTKNKLEGQKLIGWGDRFFAIINPTHRRKPHLVPQLHPSFRETLESYFSELQKLAMQLLEFLAKTLMAARGEMEEIFVDGMQAVRMNYYPPCPDPEQVMGIAPHSDASGITILHEVNGLQGLQIKKDGAWMPVHFVPNGFVVLVGDILEALSNGSYSSVEHRATVNSDKERISIAMFFNPNYNAKVGPLPSLINHHNRPLFKTLEMETYLQNYFSHPHKGKSNLEQMRVDECGCRNTIGVN